MVLLHGLSKTSNVKRLATILGLILCAVAGVGQNQNQPNIVFIFCDDLNRSGLGTLHDPAIVTPHIDSLVAQSAVFTNAHANAPICGPSRASLFTGVSPSTSGHFGYRMGNVSWESNPVLSQTETIFGHFKNNGYKVYSSGKIFHKNRNPLDDFDDLYLEPFQGPYGFDGRSHSDMPESFSPIGISFAPLENIPIYPEYTGWVAKGQPYFFESDENRDLLGDELSVMYCDSLLAAHASAAQNEPFFITLGMYSPHAPFHVPQKYFDLYPLDSIDLSFLSEDAVPFASASFSNRFNSGSNQQINELLDNAPEDDQFLLLKKFIQGYNASVSFLDEQIGAVLESLENHGFSENTYIVISSDHGYHLGSRNIIKKSTLWNDATAVPLIIKGPGINPLVTSKPVSLVDLYPTLLSLTDLPSPSQNLDGRNLAEVLASNSLEGTLLSASSLEKLEENAPGKPHHQHHAILVNNFKYILYSSGEDELYQVQNDPNELNDLSQNPEAGKFRNLLFKSMQNKVDSLRPPMPAYDNLFYGDFNQRLNGWIPSEANDVILYSEGTEKIPSAHVVITGTGSAEIRNKNIKIEESGLYRLSLKAYADQEPLSLVLRIGTISENGNQLLHQESIDLTEEVTDYEFTFFLSTPTDQPIFRARILDGSGAHLDDIRLQNLQKLEESTQFCLDAEELISGTPPSQLGIDSLLYLQNQEGFHCLGKSGIVKQKWFKITPEEELGLIFTQAVSSSGANPFFEVYADCNASERIGCSDSRGQLLEFGLISGLTPGATQFIRVGDDGFNNSNITPIKIGYQDIIPAAVIGNSGLDLTVNNFTYNFLLVDSVRFKLVNLASSNETIITLPFSTDFVYNLENLNLTPGQYAVQVGYSIKSPSIEVPFMSEYILTVTGQNVAEKDFSDFTIFPNPLSTQEESFNIIYSGENTLPHEQYTLKLYDVQGKLHGDWTQPLFGTFSQYDLPQNLSVGIYFLRISSPSFGEHVVKMNVLD